MKKNVTVTFFTHLQQDGDSDNTRSHAPGTLAKLGEKFFLEYTEPDSEMGNSKSIVKIHSKKHIELERKGIYETLFIIEEGKRHPCKYKTPFGEMQMDIHAEKVFAEVDENGGKIELLYTIKNGSQTISKNSLIMNIE